MSAQNNTAGGFLNSLSSWWGGSSSQIEPAKNLEPPTSTPPPLAEPKRTASTQRVAYVSPLTLSHPTLQHSHDYSF